MTSAFDKVVPFSRLDLAMTSKSLKARSYSTSDAFAKISVVCACVCVCVCVGVGARVESLEDAGLAVLEAVDTAA